MDSNVMMSYLNLAFSMESPGSRAVQIFGLSSKRRLWQRRRRRMKRAESRGKNECAVTRDAA
jgi:hypothetical protein